RDPFGHQWSLAETVKEVDMNELLAQMGNQA
ncbi:VOC family protein, partial [Mycobacterium sp. ITM-2017-0098]